MHGAAEWRSSFPWGGMLHLPQPPSVPLVRPAAPTAAVAKTVPKAAPKPPHKKGLPKRYGSYTNISFVLRHFGGELATKQCGSQELNVCPWSQLEGASHCAWRAGKHLRPSHLHPKDLLDHQARDHGSDPAQREQALAMTNGVMPGGLAGPRSGPSRVKGACVARGSKSHGGAGGVVVGDVEWGSRVCNGVFDGGHGSGCVTRWDRAVNRSVSWTPGDSPLNGWAAGVGVRSGKRVFAPAARPRRRRSPSFC